jgi:branched-subunit amino acid ABC-type transport system permease component
VIDFLSYVVRGVPIGCVYAMLAVGIVLTYKTSGVFNLAYGAQAYVSGVVFYELRARNHWAVPPAALVAIVVAGPLLGLLLDRVVFRHLRSSTALARLVTSLGLLVAIPALVQVFIGQNPLQNPPGLAPGHNAPNPGSNVPVYHFGTFYWDQNQVITIVATVVVAVGLASMFRWSNIGLRMRAVVESPRMAELHGVNSDRVAGASWLLSGLIAGLTGVLVAPLLTPLVAENYFTFLVAAIAAAVFGRLSSILLTFAGGLGLGALEQVVSGYLPHNSLLFAGLRPSLPFVALVLLLILWPGLRRRRETTDPLAGVDPPPPAPSSKERAHWATLATRITGTGAVVALVVVGLFVVNALWLHDLTDAVIYSIIFLSITVVTGWAGQISLCQATFAGIGGLATGQLVAHFHVSVIVAMLVGMVIAGLVGALVAIPALRLEAVYVALVTLAFGLLFDNVLVPQSWVGGGYYPNNVPRPVIGPFDLGAPAHDRSFFVLCLVILGIVAGLVLVIKHGTTGRFLDAVRGSERAASSIGIDPVRAKIVAFAVSGALAGLGGGLLAMHDLAANPSSFVYLNGLFWVLIVVTIGSRSVFGAIVAGFSLGLLPEILNTVGLSNSLLWSEVLFGLAIVTYAKYPEGIVEAYTRSVFDIVNSLIERFRSDREPPADHIAVDARLEEVVPALEGSNQEPHDLPPQGVATPEAST